MVRAWVLCVALAMTACYRPPGDGACTVSCDFGAAATCPSGLACGADNLCHAGTQCSQMVDAPGSDAVQADGATCFGTGLVRNFCPSVIELMFELTGTLDTTSDPVCTPFVSGGVTLCAITAENVLITGSVRVIGDRPLLLVGTSEVGIGGTVDLSAGGAGTTGPASCKASSGFSSTAAGVPAGGGAGGSYTGVGGDGGVPNTLPVAPASPVRPVTAVAPGCQGGDGGSGSNGTGAGAGGPGGGAIYVIAGTRIVITGTINASGGGGGAGNTNIVVAGGGGGGGGGLIGLDAPAVAIGATAVLLAQGGGGGGGDGNSMIATSGQAPAVGMPAIRAAGGIASGTTSGDGGPGSGLGFLEGINGKPATTGGAGGGGGGAGAIRIYAGNPTISPSAAIYPAYQ